MRIILPAFGVALKTSQRYHAWTPCHEQQVQVLAEQAETEDFNPISCPLCQIPWGVTFRPLGETWMAMWWVDAG